MKVAIFLVALVAVSVRASPLEGRPLKDDAEDDSIDYAADYDMSGDEEEWPGEYLETGEPSEFYLQVVREQLENRTAPQTQPLTRFRRQCQNRAAISHGALIRLQYVFSKSRWLSCWRYPCDSVQCPGMYITASDKPRCLGEKFHIYRFRGPGDIRVGDLIGIYYPHTRTWLGCGHNCVKATCPGSPSHAYGFQDFERWFRCYGEVFKIYAREKNEGTVIQQHDHVSLYHVQRQQWLSLWQDSPWGNTVHTANCPGTFPTLPWNLDGCWGEILEIWLQ